MMFSNCVSQVLTLHNGEPCALKLECFLSSSWHIHLSEKHVIFEKKSYTVHAKIKFLLRIASDEPNVER